MFPVAGLGTRFLPATKAMPKEMLTVVDRPLIQYVVDEAREAGIEHFIFVTGRNKGVIEDHFDRQYELEQTLAERGKTDELGRAQARSAAGPAQTSFTRQQEPLGLGHAVWCARELVGDEPFALLLPDMLVQTRAKPLPRADDRRLRPSTAATSSRWSPCPRTRRRITASSAWPAKAMAGCFPITGMVEKPKPGTAPSNLTSPAATSCSPRSSSILAEQEQGAGGEIQITDAMLALLKRQPFYAVKYEGRTFDCGSKVGFLTANVAYALARPDLAEAFKAEIKKLV